MLVITFLNNSLIIIFSTELKLIDILNANRISELNWRLPSNCIITSQRQFSWEVLDIVNIWVMSESHFAKLTTWLS